ncbi:MAG: ABC transporter permease [Bacteroidales bacterium]|nr:ABC transporter permease [Bacteroidales bacterium]MCF8399343.1 ABC transporter permease [Bacteroidales bacterium]
MNLIIGAFTIGLILSLLSMGMLISFRMIKFTDITVDGSFTLGASITAMLIISGWSPWLASLVAFLCGMLAGSLTGILYTRFKIQEILAGILMMTALYSVNLRIMGRSNIPLLDTSTVSEFPERVLVNLSDGGSKLSIFGWSVSMMDLAVFISSIIICSLIAWLLFRFLLTHFGTALRATGNNRQMVRAQGVNNNAMVIFSLGLSNGLVALSGALLAQYQGFADVQMGIGMMVWGLASIIIGEALVGKSSLGITITGVILGTILFRLLIAIALRWGLNPNDLKLVTAIFVFAALVAPKFFRTMHKKFFKSSYHA